MPYGRRSNGNRMEFAQRWVRFQPDWWTLFWTLVKRVSKCCIQRVGRFFVVSETNKSLYIFKFSQLFVTSVTRTIRKCRSWALITYRNVFGRALMPVAYHRDGLQTLFRRLFLTFSERFYAFTARTILCQYYFFKSTSCASYIHVLHVWRNVRHTVWRIWHLRLFNR